MKLREWIGFIDDYVSEYLEILFGTLSKPALLLNPIWKQPESGIGDGKFIFNPRLFIFSTLSILLGLIIQSFIPNHRTSENYVRAVTLITLLWILFSCVGYFILFPNRKQWSFLDSVSLIFQVLSVQYVIASLAALVWGILHLGLRSLGIPENPSPVYEILGNSPIFVYFFVQFLFLSIYLPYAVVTGWRLTRTAFILRTFSTVMLAFLWSTFSFFALQVTDVGPITPIILTPTDMPMQPPTPTLPPVDEEKLNILLAALDGPEATYGFRDQMLNELNADFSGDETVQIIPVDIAILVSQGSEAARELGIRYHADLVIWGWYRDTEPPNITIYIENLVPEQLLPLETSRTLQPDATLAELNSFRFQNMTAQEMSAFISFLAGFFEHQAGDNENAIAYFNKSLKDLEGGAMMFENQAEIYFYRGSARFLLGMYDPAIEDFNESIKLGAERPSVYNNRGNVYLDLGENDLALEDYTKAIELDPGFVSAYNGRGNAYGERKEYEQALRDYNKAIDLDPNYVYAYNNRGNAYFDLGNYHQALQDYDKVVHLDPNYAIGYSNRGNAYRELGEYEQALRDHNKAIALDPGLLAAYLGRGNTYKVMGNDDLALQDYNQAITLAPDLPDPYNDRGNFYGELGEENLAIQDYTKAIKLDETYIIAYNGRGNSYNRLGEYQKAIQDFTAAIALDPTYVLAYNGRGSSYLHLNEFDQAIENYNQALELDPDYMLAYYNRGNVYFDLEEYNQAVQDYTKAIALDPGYEPAYLSLAASYGYLKEFEKGIVEIEKLIEINPRNADAYLIRGKLYQAQGKTAEAEADFTKYEALTGEKP
jgi:tetratricopeptide (TPR) repeat protein